MIDEAELTGLREPIIRIKESAKKGILKNLVSIAETKLQSTILMCNMISEEFTVGFIEANEPQSHF